MELQSCPGAGVFCEGSGSGQFLKPGNRSEARKSRLPDNSAAVLIYARPCKNKRIYLGYIVECTVFRKKTTNNMNFSLRVVQYKKHQYQEGNENDCKFLCKDGVVFGGSTVLSFASRFMEMAIIKEREKQTGEELKAKKAVELDFKLYETKTIKVKRIKKTFLK